MTKEEIYKRADIYVQNCPLVNADSVEMKRGYIDGAIKQYKIDIEVIPQLYVRWLMLEMDNKPTWIDYINQINGIK